MIATARIYIQKAPSKKTQDDLCPVKLCITHNRKRTYYSIKDKIKKDEWLFVKSEDIQKIMNDSPRGKYREIREEYDRIIQEAKEVIVKMKVFSFGAFEDQYFNKPQSWDNIFVALIDHIKFLKSEGRFGYASSFESTLRAIKEYHNKKSFSYLNRVKTEERYKIYLSGKELFFSEINAAWLKKFEKWLTQHGKSISTTGIYMRNLRVMFNLAIKDYKINTEYPFTKYKPKKATGRKMALKAYQIKLIADYKTKDPVVLFYRDLFMFSFLANGMNNSDLARLRFSDIKRNQIEFKREKTRNKDKQTSIKVPITKQMQYIIDRHGNKAIGHDAFLFPILAPKMTDEKRFTVTKQFTKMMNKYIQRIAEEVGITDRVSSYTARHSWATISKNSGVSTEFIKEQLGHSNVNVTEAYLDSFESETVKKHSDMIENQIYKHG